MNVPLTISPSLREGTDLPSPITRALAFGYHDGPTEGVLQVGQSGEVYRFTLSGELRGKGRDDTDLRVFALAPLPRDALEVLAAVLAPHFTPNWPLWVPVWRFPNKAAQEEVEQRIDDILQQAGPVKWHVTTEDLFGTLQAVTGVTQG
jgi:hypothetical protein